ncbi:MAG: 30S ribosomal protein S2 [Parcubacteria group bacterium]|jgi:small subunit ribosomal protein S2
MTNEENAAVKQEEADVVTNNVASKNKSEDYFADFNFEGLEVDMRFMLKNGVHFGHQKARKNPKMNEYIFGTKNGINIINLEKTVEKMEEAKNFIEKIVSEGQDILFVGTKKQAKNIVESAARACGMPYVVERWLGGTFTNFKNISGRTRYLRDGQEKMKKGEYAKYTKFEQMKMAEELGRLESRMGGIKNMMKLPGAIFVTGVLEDNLAVQEARKKNIPIIALVDTNIDPGVIDYPIPANEDAVSSLRLMVGYVCKAILEGKEKMGAAKKIAAEANAKALADKEEK